MASFRTLTSSLFFVHRVAGCRFNTRPYPSPFHRSLCAPSSTYCLPLLSPFRLVSSPLCRALIKPHTSDCPHCTWIRTYALSHHLTPHACMDAAPELYRWSFRPVSCLHSPVSPPSRRSHHCPPIGAQVPTYVHTHTQAYASWSGGRVCSRVSLSTVWLSFIAHRDAVVVVLVVLGM
ncbi:hypothetical protein C8Q76DRAFT_240163 [Earliella scabrosa]|nr:hypothetical protein C8Q76DRAFT_240163 [Earliella scabrosa]